MTTNEAPTTDTTKLDVRARERADQFRMLHCGPEPLRLVNVWDLVSSRVAECAGATALGTSSFAVATAHGYPDGEHVPWSLVRDLVREITEAVNIPVTVDVEAGRGADPDAVATTVAEVIAAGAVGINLEDSRPNSPGALFDIGEQRARLEAGRHAADAGGIHRFVNARCDVWFGANLAQGDQLPEARRRARAYADAGADGLFVPGLVDTDALRILADDAGLPVNVMLWPGLPAVDALQAAGVRRLSQGGASFLQTLGGLEHATSRYLTVGDPGADDAATPAPAYHLVGHLSSLHQ